MAMTSTAATSDRRRRSLVIVGAAAMTSLALVAFMVTSVTRAAWTDTTDNTGNSWATGEVSLTDDDEGVAMFTAADMVPGDVVTNSITVTNASSVPLDVRLYGADLVDTDLLAQHLNLKIGTSADSYDVYDADTGVLGTLLDFSSDHTAFGNGTTATSLDAGATQTYHFWVELDADTPDSFQAKSAGIGFVWEGQTQ